MGLIIIPSSGGQKDLIIASTGLREFGGISINVDNTKFDLGIIKGRIIDNTTDPDNPTEVDINIAPQTGISPDYLLTNPVTYIGWSASGIEQEPSMFTAEQRRTIIPLGVVVHSNNTTINAFNDIPLVELSPYQQLVDIVEKVGIFNGGGNIISANGATLEIVKSEGSFVKMGINYINNALNPNEKTLPLLVSPTFNYRNQGSSEGPGVTNIDPNTYDVGGVTTTVPNNRWHIQRVAVFSSNIIRVQRAQQHYANRNTAIANLDVENYIIEDNINQNGLIIGYIVLQEGMTDLTGATFIKASKFQNAGGGGASATWAPTALTLGDGTPNGATLSPNAGAGLYVNFASGADNEWLVNVGLERNGVQYDGSDLVIAISWMKFGATGGTVNWEIDYAFTYSGDDAYSKVDGTLAESVDVTSLANQSKTTTKFLPISSTPGAEELQLTIRRNSQGAGSDSYSGPAEMYGINFNV